MRATKIPSDEIRVLRAAAYVNQRNARQLAYETGIDRLRVERLLRGDRQFKAGEFEALRRALGLDRTCDE